MAHVCGPCLLLYGSSVTIFLLDHCSLLIVNTLDFGAGAYLGTILKGDQSYAFFYAFLIQPREEPNRPLLGMGAVTTLVLKSGLVFFVTCCSEWNESFM